MPIIDKIQLSGTVYTIGSETTTVDQTIISGSTNAVAGGAVYNKIDEVEQVTARALNELNEEVSEKQDTLVSGTNIKTINNESILGSGNINIQGGSDINVVQTTGYSTTDVMSQDAVTYSIYMLEQSIPHDYINSIEGYDNDRYFRFGKPNDYYYFGLKNAKINGRQVLSSDWSSQDDNEYNLVETSAITTSISSGSTNSQVPSAKAMYDKFDEVEQVTAAGLNALNDKFDGLKLKKLTQAQYDALSGNTDSNTLYVIVN